MKLCACDFEFCRPAEPDMGLICVALCAQDSNPELYWLRDVQGKQAFLDRFTAISKDHVFVGYSIQQAEARCIAALGLDPNKSHWRDLMLEWKWLRNGDNRYSYGKIIHNGFPRITVPPKVRVGKKASQSEIDEAKDLNDSYLQEIKDSLNDDQVDVAIQEAGWSMLDCSYFFGTIGYKDYNDAAQVKAHVRDEIIIKGSDEEIEANRDVISDYCKSDVKDLLQLANVITGEMEKVSMETHMLVGSGAITWVDFEGKVPNIQLEMGDWAARLAKYALRGLPLSKERLERLIEVVPELQKETKDSWIRQHPEAPLYRIGYSETMLALKKNGVKKSPYIENKVCKDDALLEELVVRYCEQAKITNWPRTRTKKVDTSAKVLERYASGENIIKHYQRHMNQLSALRTYAPNPKGEIEALRYIGLDYVQRPDFGPYGTQTARNAAKAKSYCFLGPHWIRMLVSPPKGKVVYECDYSAEEVFIGAALTGDQNLVDSYLSNDVYMYYAQLTGMYPRDLPVPTEEQRSEDWFKAHKLTRNISKTLFLSMQYGASAKSVAAAVRVATKQDGIPDEQGEEWVTDYKHTYSDFTAISESLRREYRDGTSIALADGFRMGPDNPSALSAGNLPYQGTGTLILRRACELADERGLYVVATLHDAITGIADEGKEQEDAATLSECMAQAAEEILGRKGMKIGAPEFVRHGDWWIHSEKAKMAWERMRKYFI